MVFEGNHNLKEDKLRDEVQVRPRGVFTKSKVQADVQRDLQRSGINGDTCFAVKLALEESLVNAVRHGNRLSGHRAFAGGLDAGSRAHPDYHLRARLRDRRDAVSPRERAGKDRPADADLGAVS